MKKIISFILVISILFSLTTISFANSPIVFNDVTNSYWGKNSIDYVSSKGYMVGYGDRFGVSDPVTEGQYLAVLCRIFGYKNLSPLDAEKPARELGLVLNNETISINSNLKRDKIVKYTIRAFELLNPNVTYPDYLDAYKPMIKDYNNLSIELKPLVLKCVEKGLLAGGPDGNFNPNDETTRAQAAAFIHRILEQSERNKVMPVFATPDAEFEAFMNSPEAENYVSPYDISRVVDGKILWKVIERPGEEYLLPVYYNKDVNKTVYEALKTFTADARKNRNYVNARYLYLADNPHIKLTYYSSEKSGGRYDGGQYNLLLKIMAEPYKLDDGGNQRFNTDYYWEIMSLGASDYYEWEGMDEIVSRKYKLDEFMIPLKNIMKTIYGEVIGEYLYNYSINEWNIGWDAVYAGNVYSNSEKLYIEKFKLEIQNYCPYEGGCPKFGTNDIGM